MSKLQRHRQKGSPSATLFLKLFEEYDFKRDWNDAFARLNRIAQQEPNAGTLRQVSEALTVLAMMYEDGIGIPKDESTTVELYKRASDMGNDVAQCSLGVIYSRGRVLEKVRIFYRFIVVVVFTLYSGIFGGSLSFRSSRMSSKRLNCTKNLRCKATLRRCLILAQHTKMVT